MNELTDTELHNINGGELSSDTVYATAVGVSLFALGALITIATAGAAAPAVVAIGMGVVGTVANGTAIAASID